MSATLLQLKAIGNQDSFLTGNPEISFFRKVYKRHTNFAMESSEIVSRMLSSNGTHNIKFDVLRYGDLLSKLVVEVTLLGDVWFPRAMWEIAGCGTPVPRHTLQPI